MFIFILAAKRAVRSVYFPILLILCTVITLSAPILGKEESVPPAGICDFDNTADSAAVVAYLLEEGFEICPDEDTLRKKVTSGEFDCGVIIKQDFSNALSENELESAAVFLTSPLSFSEEIYKNHVSAAIFARLAPLITAEVMGGDVLDEIGVTHADIIEEYDRRISLGPLFRFELLDINSEADFSDDRARVYLIFFASILIFTAVMYSVGDSASEDISSLCGRLGTKNYLLFVTLPNLSVRIFGIALSLTFSAVLENLIFNSCTVMGLLPGLFSYILFILSFALIASILLRKATDFRTLTVIILLASLVLCPAYIDLSAIWRPIVAIRGFLPTYWLWFCKGSPHILLLALPILTLASAIFAINANREKGK